MVREKFKFLRYAPVVFLSALTGERMEKLYSVIDKCGGGAAAAHFDRRAESLARERGPRPRNVTCQPQSENLLRDAGRDRAADVRAVHEPDQAAALQLSAIP